MRSFQLVGTPTDKAKVGTGLPADKEEAFLPPHVKLYKVKFTIVASSHKVVFSSDKFKFLLLR